MNFLTSHSWAGDLWRAGVMIVVILSIVAIVAGSDLGPVLDGIVPFTLVSCLASLGAVWAFRLIRRQHSLAHRAAARTRSSMEAWTVAAAAQDELRRAQDRYEKIVDDLKASRDEAIAANHARAMFVAGMSHELRTPLNAIIGFSEVLEMELFGPLGDDRNREYVQDIRKSGQHLLSMINDILDMSKIDAGRMELDESAVDLARIIGGCRRMMRQRAEEAGVELTADIPDDRQLYIRADEVRLKQILFNLLSNAIKFTPAGGKIVVSARETEAGEVAITVMDSGIGIRAEDIAVAFEPFRQVDDSLSRRAGGTGLGLSLSRALVEMHGGSLKLVSGEGKGTTVTVTLPNLIAEWTPSADEGAAASQHGPERVLAWLNQAPGN
jgi:two-component system cell cycle sensor histidine kinase PleC